LGARLERLIASAIREMYLKPERPIMASLIEQIGAASLRRPDDQGAH